MAIERSKVDIKVSGDFIPFINKLGSGKTLDDKVNLSIAIGLFVSKNVTLARAAELAELAVGEFIDILVRQGIPWGEYSEDEEKMDDVSVQNLLERMAENLS
jgi:predicted HTH domain antitoxin